jgi:SAM-dependent methyltransferase
MSSAAGPDVAPVPGHGGSASLGAPEYWWYVARTELLRTVLEERIGAATLMLDVGSADGPSVGWLDGHGTRVMLDIDPRGLEPGGVCGSAMALPFADGTFDVVSAFDVVEHCEPEALALEELARVLTPGGRLLISVPAYQWAWTEFDEENGHHRRYTRERAERAVEAAGLTVTRSTYAFAGVFPFFAAERLARRLRRAVRGRSQDQHPVETVSLPEVHPLLQRMFLWLSRREEKVLARRDLPFGSSVVVAAEKP